MSFDLFGGGLIFDFPQCLHCRLQCILMCVKKMQDTTAFSVTDFRVRRKTNFDLSRCLNSAERQTTTRRSAHGIRIMQRS